MSKLNINNINSTSGFGTSRNSREEISSFKPQNTPHLASGTTLFSPVATSRRELGTDRNFIISPKATTFGDKLNNAPTE